MAVVWRSISVMQYLLVYSPVLFSPSFWEDRRKRNPSLEYTRLREGF
jgi:hypothetical protein